MGPVPYWKFGLGSWHQECRCIDPGTKSPQKQLVVCWKWWRAQVDGTGGLHNFTGGRMEVDRTGVLNNFTGGRIEAREPSGKVANLGAKSPVPSKHNSPQQCVATSCSETSMQCFRNGAWHLTSAGLGFQRLSL